VLASLMAGGPNAGYSGGIFGHGTYFAEDAAKNDQVRPAPRAMHRAFSSRALALSRKRS
jgi:hypothetical protein